MTQDLNYAPEDILHIARGLPLESLRARRPFEHTFGAQVAELKAHPEVATYSALAALEGFEPTAALCRLLSVYTTEMRDDLLRHPQHPKLEWLGAALTLLAPQSSDAACFQGTNPPWIVAFARVKAAQDLDAQDSEANALIQYLQTRLSNIAPPPVEIWATRDIPKAEFQAFTAAIGELYKSNGADAAQEFLRESQNAETELGRYLRYRFNRWAPLQTLAKP